MKSERAVGLVVVWVIGTMIGVVWATGGLTGVWGLVSFAAIWIV